MKPTTKICRNCRYGNINQLRKWCSYWRSEIGCIVAAYGCEKFEEETEND